MGNVPLASQIHGGGELTEFQKNKLTFDFNTFFDLNHDGFLSYKDFLWAKDRICQMSGWKMNCEKYKKTEVLFTNIWTSLVDVADTDHDGKITIIEWLTMWECYKKELVEKEKETEDFLKKFYAKHNPDFRKLKNMGKHLGEGEEKNGTPKNQKKVDTVHANNKANEAKDIEKGTGETILPIWLHDYLRFRFDLLDRVGDGIIDTEEYEYVLSEFGLKEKDARQAFLIFSQHLTITIDFDYFIQLFEEYYLSDDPSDLGNFVNGKLEFPTSQLMEAIPEEEAVAVAEEQLQINIELYKDDMMTNKMPEQQETEKKKDLSKSIKKIRKRLWKNFKLNCLPLSDE